VYFYEHQPTEALILDEVTDITIKDKKNVGWTVIVKEQFEKLNLGNEEKPKEVLINTILSSIFPQILKIWNKSKLCIEG